MKKPKFMKNKPLKSKEEFENFKIFQILKINSEENFPKLIEESLMDEQQEFLELAGISLESNPRLEYEQNIFSHPLNIIQDAQKKEE